jgi:cytochrome P450
MSPPPPPSPVTVDLWSSSSFAHGHPHDQYAQLRREAPVYRHDEPGGRGFWAVTKYHDVKDVGKDAATFSSVPVMTIADLPEGMQESSSHVLMCMDPPKHTRHRMLVNRSFTPRNIEAMSDRIDAMAAEVVDRVCERGECDFVEDVAGMLPSYVIAELLGIPLDDGVRLYSLTEVMHAAPDAVSGEARAAASGEMLAYAADVMRTKLRVPGDDLATQLVHSEVDGDRLSEADFLSFFLLLVNAGGDTTRHLAAGGMHTLFELPDQRALLQSRLDDLLPSAVEEMLRYISPVVYQRRTATRDTVLHGQPISAGDKVVMYYASANRDEDVFERADEFDVQRAPNEHVAFGGGGPHFCLGAHIARLEIRSLFQQLLQRLPDIERAGETQWNGSNFTCGPAHLPVRFTPQRAD